MLISGDQNRNAKVVVRYREVGSTTWRDGQPLFRVFPRNRGQPVPEQFAGSIFDLKPDTAYEIELHATDVDGPVSDVRTITGRTRPVPIANPATPRTVNVSTASALRSALSSALPGDVIVIANGTYTGTFSISNSGTASNPIVIRGLSDKGVILDGQNCASCNVMEISGSHVHVENLTIRNARRAIKFVVSGLRNNVVRRLQIKDVIHGMDGVSGYRDFYVCDNVIDGRLFWPWVYEPDPNSHWDDRGILLSGSGHVICHNWIRGFGEPIAGRDHLYRAVDIYGNHILDSYDTVEFDYSAGNVRFFHNRVTNVSNASSFQPVNGGPAYYLRNVVLNPRQQLKFANDPSGMLVYHNTFVSPVRALNFQNSATGYNFKVMNNLFVGPTIVSGRMIDWGGGIGAGGKFDFNGYYPDGGIRFGSQTWSNFSALKSSGVFEGGGTLLTGPIFTSGLLGPTDEMIRQNPVDFTLASGSNAKDRGTVLPGINQSFADSAPDLGALESGCPTPTYGPRPVGSEHATNLIDCGFDNAPSPPPPTPFTLLKEAESFALVSPPMTVGSDANALGGSYISPTSGVDSTSPVREASVSVSIPATDTHYLWVRMMGPTIASDALYAGINSSWDRTFSSSTGNYEWIRVETLDGSGTFGFSLTQGTHTIQIGHGEINARLDAIYLTNNFADIPAFAPAPPLPPLPPSNLTISPGVAVLSLGATSKAR